MRRQPRPDNDARQEPEEAKAIELQGWDYPRHLAGRLFALVVHGDAAGAEVLRRSLTDWLLDMNLVQAGHAATIDRYIGYYEPYATSHDALDRDEALHTEVRNAAKILMEAVSLARDGKFPQPGERTQDPRPK